PNSGMVDIEPIDLFDLDSSDRKRRCLSTNLLIEANARVFIERLRIVDAFNLRSRRKYDRRRDDRTRQGPHSNFIHTGDVMNSRFPKQSFEMKHRVQTVSLLLLLAVAFRQNFVETPRSRPRIAFKLAQDRRRHDLARG